LIKDFQIATKKDKEPIGSGKQAAKEVLSISVVYSMTAKI